MILDVSKDAESRRTGPIEPLEQQETKRQCKHDGAVLVKRPSKGQLGFDAPELAGETKYTVGDQVDQQPDDEASKPAKNRNAYKQRGKSGFRS